MIFGSTLIPKVLAGEKTVTRRPAKLEDGGYGGAIYLPCKYEVGKTYAVQPVIEDGPGKGRGGKSVGRIRVLSVERRGLCWGWGRRPDTEARREGFSTFADFRRYWSALYGTYDPQQLVDRIEFELVPESVESEAAA